MHVRWLSLTLTLSLPRTHIKSTQSVFIGYIGYGHLFKPDGNLAELGFTYRPRWEETKERALLMRYIFASVYAFVVCEFRLLPLARALMRCLWGARRRRDLAPMPPPSMKLAVIQDACPSVFPNERTQFHLIPMYFQSHWGLCLCFPSTPSNSKSPFNTILGAPCKSSFAYKKKTLSFQVKEILVTMCKYTDTCVLVWARLT